MSFGDEKLSVSGSGDLTPVLLLILAVMTTMTMLPINAEALNLFSSDVLTVQLTVVDDAGQPVPYATIGSSWTPFSKDPVKALEPDDLRRVLYRYPETWEYWNGYVRPLPKLQFSGLTNVDGTLKDQIDYQEAAGRDKDGNRIPRPNELTIAYGVYRKGYDPAQQVITVKRDVKRTEVRIVLKRAPDYVAKIPVYRQTLDQVRAEISDWRANERISMANHDRLERLRARLETAAQEAISAGDQRAAAQIMYWVAFMPEITVIDGKPVGYSQTNFKSERNFLAFKRAAELDPMNVHIQSIWLSEQKLVLFRAAQNQSDAAARAFTETWLKQALALDRLAGDKLWPVFHEEMIRSFGFMEQYEAQYKKIKWMIQYEPKFSDYSSDLRVLEAHQRKGQ